MDCGQNTWTDNDEILGKFYSFWVKSYYFILNRNILLVECDLKSNKIHSFANDKRTVYDPRPQTNK